MPPLVSLLQPGDTVLVGTGAGEPRELIEDLISASRSISGGVRVIQIMAGGPSVWPRNRGMAYACRLPYRGSYPEKMRDELPTEAASRIGAFVAECVPDGATVELGIGRALAGVPAALIETRRKLALHTGLVGDAAMRMIEAGCVDRPIFDDAFAVGATAMGTAAFYRWADGNPSIAITDSRIAHNIEHLSGQRTFVAINGALEVDLTGAANSSVQRGRIISGIGGARDFAIAGANGCASIIAIPATTERGESNIVPKVEFETIPASAVTHVVTEFGVARLKGRNANERARALINIAAPIHRSPLLKALRELP